MDGENRPVETVDNSVPGKQHCFGNTVEEPIDLLAPEAVIIQSDFVACSTAPEAAASPESRKLRTLEFTNISDHPEDQLPTAEIANQPDNARVEVEQPGLSTVADNSAEVEDSRTTFADILPLHCLGRTGDFRIRERRQGNAKLAMQKS